MKRTLAALCLTAAAFAQTQSADNASIVNAAKRSSAATAKAKRVYTDDDLPTSGEVNVVGKEAHAKKGSNDPVRDQAALDRQWQARIDQQKAKIANLQRQIDLAQKSLTYSTRRDPTKPNPGYAREKSQIDSLQQQLADAKDKLSQIQDEAHKAGADKAYD